MRPPGMQEVRFRWWWVLLGLVWFPALVLMAPFWLALLVPLRYSGFPAGVGRLGGLPRTGLGRWYGASAAHRVAVWLLISLAWFGVVATAVPGGDADGMGLVAMVPVFGFGWWWHLERVLGRRRLARWFRLVPTDFERELAEEAGTQATPMYVPVEGPIVVRRPEVPLLYQPSAPAVEYEVEAADSTVDVPDDLSSLVLPADDLRHRKAGVSAREKAVSERATGVPEDRVNQSWIRGAEGEEIAAEALSMLPAGWTVIHDVPIGLHGANVDHVVIGPAGVFTVNTKHYKGAIVEASGPQVVVRGRLSDHRVKAKEEAQRASELLTRALGSHVPVSPVLLYVGARSVSVNGDPFPVLFTTNKNVRDVLTRQPSTISDWAVDGLVAVACRPETWAQRTYGLTPGGAHFKASQRVSTGSGCLGVAMVFGGGLTALGYLAHVATSMVFSV